MFSTRTYVIDLLTGEQHQIIRTKTLRSDDFLDKTFYLLDKKTPTRLNHSKLFNRWRTADQLQPITTTTQKDT